MVNSKAIQYRKGTKSDLSSVFSLIQALADFEKAPQEVTVTLAEMEKDGFGEQAIFEFFVAETEQKIVGFVLFYEKYSTWKGRCLFLEDFFVDADYRRCGIGERLFCMVKQEAKERGSKRMEWQVLDWNEVGLSFYQKQGAGLDPEWINGKYTYEQLQEKEWV